MNEMKKLMEALDRINEVRGYDETEALIDEMDTFLEETKYKIQELKNVLSALLGHDSPAYGRARYWISSIESALDDESEWMSGPMFKMQGTIDELRDSGEDEGYGEEGLEEDSSDEGAVMVGGKAVDMQSLSFAGVDFLDYPDFCDAWIEEALFVDGSQLSQDQIDELGEKYTDEVYERLMSKIF